MADSAFRLGHASLEEQVVREGGNVVSRTHEASDQQAAGGQCSGCFGEGAQWGAPLQAHHARNFPADFILESATPAHAALRPLARLRGAGGSCLGGSSVCTTCFAPRVPSSAVPGAAGGHPSTLAGVAAPAAPGRHFSVGPSAGHLGCAVRVCVTVFACVSGSFTGWEGMCGHCLFGWFAGFPVYCSPA